MRRVLAVVPSIVAATALLGAGGSAPSADEPFLVPTKYETGYVAVSVNGRVPGGRVVFSEAVGGRTTLVGVLPIGADGNAPLYRAVKWRCDRRVRHFTARVTDPDGTVHTAIADMQTPSCTSRVALVLPKHVPRGRPLKVKLVDRWALGNRDARVCVNGARLTRACRDLALAPGPDGVSWSVRPRHDGHVRVAMSFAGTRKILTAAVGAARPRPRTEGPVLLATGDSTIEGIDSVLDAVLGSVAKVRSFSFPGTNLSGTGDAEWYDRARDQVKRRHPAITVLSIGGNEAFPIGQPDGTSVECCGEAWVAGLARRQRKLMKIYVQGGSASVIWQLLPVPRSAGRATIATAVTKAARRAAEGLDGVHLVDQSAIFTPDGTYRDAIELGGRPVRVRAPDGIHLSAEGQAIAAKAVEAVIARDGLLDQRRR